MATVTIHPGKLNGVVDAPPSKSESHRALLLASLAKGKSVLSPVVLSEDTQATLRAVGALGALIERTGDKLRVNGGVRTSGTALIDCGESGSTLRFLVPVALAAGIPARFVGRGRLGQRPMEPYERICREQNLTYERSSGRTLDLKVSGQLKPGRFELPGDISSQFVSGLAMALPLLNAPSTIHLTSDPESRGYIDLTLHMMRAFGVNAAFDGRTLTVPGGARYRGCERTISGDYSQAAVFLCAAALGHGVQVRGLDPASLQPDQAVLTHLMRMGAGVSEIGGLTTIVPGELNGTTIDVSQCPDIAPMLALTASLAGGETRIVNAARLRLKESDRLTTTREALTALGADIREEHDALVITGVAQLRGGTALDCAGDHRIAMMIAIAALTAEAPVTLHGSECLNKSYPGFLKDLTELGGNVYVR